VAHPQKCLLEHFRGGYILDEGCLGGDGVAFGFLLENAGVDAAAGKIQKMPHAPSEQALQGLFAVCPELRCGCYVMLCQLLLGDFSHSPQLFEPHCINEGYLLAHRDPA